MAQGLLVHLMASIILLGVCTAPSTARAADQWIQVGMGVFSPTADEPGGLHHQSGRIAQVSWAWDNEQSRHVLWAGASLGGLWKAKYDESGDITSWVPLTDNFPGSHVLGSFAVKKGDSQRIVIGTGSLWGGGDGIWYTTKGGEIWHAAAVPAKAGRVNRIVADKSDSTGETLVATTSAGIWISSDFGEHWHPTNLTGVEATDVVQDTDKPSHWYAGVAEKGIYRSETSAESWEQPPGYGTGIKGSAARISLTMCEKDPHDLFALVLKGGTNQGKLNGVYRSAAADPGATWTKITPKNENAVVDPDAQLHASAIACNPTDSRHVIFGITKSVETRNADANPTLEVPTWTLFDGGHGDYNFMLFTEDGTAVHIANDGGVYRYEFGGEPGTGTLHDSANLLGINALSLGQTGLPHTSLQGGLASSWSQPQIFVGGLQDNDVVRGDMSSSSGPAITLLVQEKVGDGRHVSIMPDNPDVVGFLGNGNCIRCLDKSGTVQKIDFGLTKEKTAAVLIDPTPALVRPPGAGPFIFTSGQFGAFLGVVFSRVYYTDVASPGPSWERVGKELEPITGPGIISHVDAVVDPDIYQIVVTVAGDTGVYSYIGSRDQPLRNLTLSEISPPRPSNPKNPDARINADRHPYQPDTLYYTSGLGKPTRAHVSRDGGQSWTDVKGDIDSMSDNAKLLKLIGHPALENEFFLATTKGVFRSVDGGRHWEDYSEGLRYHEEVEDIVITSDLAHLLIATRGRGFWRRKIH